LRLVKPLGDGGDKDFLPLYAGQSAALARETNAAVLMARLAAETDHCLKRFS